MNFYTALCAVDWQVVGNRTATVARFIWVVLQILAMVMVMSAEVAYEHRQQIRDFVVKAVAFVIILTEDVNNSGVKTRAWVSRIGLSSAEILKEMPEQVAPVAPVVSPIIAVSKSVAAALTDWLQLDDADDDEVANVVEEKPEISMAQRMEELMSLPAATLREMVGTRSRYPKAKLVSMLMAA